jgi:hypothetical protein
MKAGMRNALDVPSVLREGPRPAPRGPSAGAGGPAGPGQAIATPYGADPAVTTVTASVAVSMTERLFTPWSAT